MLDLDTVSAVRQTADLAPHEAGAPPHRPQARRARIARLQRLVAAGEYAIDPPMVAAAILDRIAVPRSAT
jgi:anti-sigma28 factor (negative regulator of flagellin synthesis)